MSFLVRPTRSFAFCCEVSAIADVKLWSYHSEVFYFAKNEVKFAHFAEGKTSLRSNFTAGRQLHLPEWANLTEKTAGRNLPFFLVRPTRFERATYRVGVCHSIQLSYERICNLAR